MKLNIRVLLGFLLIIILVVTLVGINYTLNKDRLNKTNQIKDVESPLELMVEQVIGYDAILTGNAHAALLHLEKGDLEGVREHKEKYDEIGVKLDTLLKVDAKNLIEKSQRPQEIKNEVSIILKKLDEANLALVDLETRAFDAMNKNDTETAYALIVSENYHTHKEKLDQLYKNWSYIESTATNEIRTQIIEQSNKLTTYNLYFAGIIIILTIITSFLVARSISKPIKKLKENVDEISRGKLDLQIEKSSISEIQSLIDSLNRILATMKLAILRTGLSGSDLGIGEAIRMKEEAEDRYKVLYESSSDAIMTLEPPTWNFTSAGCVTIRKI